MNLIGPQRPIRQPQGVATLNSAHPFAGNVKFALVPSISGLRSFDGRHVLTAAAGAVRATCVDGAGWRHNSSSGQIEKGLSAAEVADFTGNVTIIWRGVILGNHGVNNTRVFSIEYGQSNSSPFCIATMYRDGNNNDTLSFGTNNNSFLSANFSSGLSARYGRPTTIVMSNAAGQAAVVCAVITEGGNPYLATVNLGSASGSPRLSTTINQLTIGGYAPTAGDTANAVTTGAVILNRAVNQSVAKYLADSFWSFFASGAGSLSPALLQAAAAPPPANNNNLLLLGVGD